MRVIIKAWTFLSSNGKTKYQTLGYSDGSTSCDCRGWIYKARRMCKHTRSVDMRTADSECISFCDYTAQHPGVTNPFASKSASNGGATTRANIKWNDKPTLRKIRFEATTKATS